MRQPSLHFVLQALLVLGHGVVGRPNGQDGSCGGPAAAKAIYMITNDESNGVVALPVGRDGKLSKGTVTSTQGRGSVALHSDGKPATPDALVSQSALTIAGKHIFAVNAGSNTLSMLAISAADPTKLSLVGQPVAIPGEFPNTVAASAKNSLVCVGTTGSKSGISCSPFSDAGLRPMDELRPFDLGQTTPPVGPTNTVSQVFFSADESQLFCTVKGDPATNKTGFFSAFPVERQAPCRGGAGSATLSKTDTRSVPEGSAVLFGSQTIPGTSNVFATDASFGGMILSINQTSRVATTVAKSPIQGQAATCWVAISSTRGTAFVTDVAVNRLVEMSLKDASIVSEMNLSANGDPGLIDLRTAGQFLYALSPGNGTTEGAVTVVDLAGSAKMVQHFGLRGMAGKRAQGMAVLV
ncbi:3-carboxymuconate cyclase protein [Purpureocillium lavendulum]|uniref:3-carboxymuconate cyclase protein n=1 Tax=Purpureocillium lavendulum TaxID=1247861 RepID=A0AB34FMQ9_9HYPO|nr:3-carboxymuconate cyclase protein [Purpureocillium lavendulum]